MNHSGSHAGGYIETMQRVAWLADEERHLHAIRTLRTADSEAVRINHARGMSRRRLIEIYGQDIVDQVLASRPSTEGNS